MKELRAFYDAVIVKPIEVEETVYGNIIVPDMGKDTNTFGPNGIYYQKQKNL